MNATTLLGISTLLFVSVCSAESPHVLTSAKKPTVILVYLAQHGATRDLASTKLDSNQLDLALQALQAVASIAQGIITIVCTNSVASGTTPIVQGIEQFAHVVSEEHTHGVAHKEVQD